MPGGYHRWPSGRRSRWAGEFERKIGPGAHPSVAVVAAVGAATDTNPIDLPPRRDTLDPDWLAR